MSAAPADQQEWWHSLGAQRRYWDTDHLDFPAQPDAYHLPRVDALGAVGSPLFSVKEAHTDQSAYARRFAYHWERWRNGMTLDERRKRRRSSTTNGNLEGAFSQIARWQERRPPAAGAADPAPDSMIACTYRITEEPPR